MISIKELLIRAECAERLATANHTVRATLTAYAAELRAQVALLPREQGHASAAMVQRFPL